MKYDVGNDAFLERLDCFYFCQVFVLCLSYVPLLYFHVSQLHLECLLLTCTVNTANLIFRNAVETKSCCLWPQLESSTSENQTLLFFDWKN